MIRYIAALVVAASLAGAAHAQVAGDPAREKAFMAQIDLARASPGFRENIWGLDVYRALQASGLPLTSEQRATAGEHAMNRGIPIEAEILLKPLVDTGEFGGDKDQKRARNAAFFGAVQRNADADRKGGLQKTIANAATRPNGRLYVAVGESYTAMGDYATAVTMLEAGVAKDALESMEASYAALNLGIAQYRSGNVPAARATWSAISGDGGAKELAKAWLMIAQG